MSTTKVHWTPRSNIDYYANGNGTLIFNTDGWPFGGDEIRIEQPPGLSAASMLVVAEQVFKGVQEWRDFIIGAAQRENPRLHLLDIIRREGGEWTVGRAKPVYRRLLGRHTLRATIRRDLRWLEANGHLEEHGYGTAHRFYTYCGGDA